MQPVAKTVSLWQIPPSLANEIAADCAIPPETADAEAY